MIKALLTIKLKGLRYTVPKRSKIKNLLGAKEYFYIGNKYS